VHDQPGGLLDHQQMVVFVHEGYDDARVGLQLAVGRPRGDVDLEHVAVADPVRPGRDGPAVHDDRPGVDQRRGLRPAAPGDDGDHPVEPLAVERPRHDLSHVEAARIAQPRPERPWSGRYASKPERPAASG
jgi:hypothetical protein